MNLDLSEDQEMMRETFARFLNEHSSPSRVRAALPGGFDPALWAGLAELGAFSLRVPAGRGGLGFSLLDAAVLMEEAGRTLVSGPLAETLVVARLLAMLGDGADGALLDRVLRVRRSSGSPLRTSPASPFNGSPEAQWPRP